MKNIDDCDSKSTEENSIGNNEEHFSKAVNVKIAGVPGRTSPPNDTKPSPREEETKSEMALIIPNKLSEKEKTVNKTDSHTKDSQAVASKSFGK